MHKPALYLGVHHVYLVNDFTLTTMVMRILLVMEVVR